MRILFRPKIKLYDGLAFAYGHRRDELMQKKIITIEAQQYPRELTGNQREQIVSKLKAFAGSRISVLGVGGPEGGDFGEQIRATIAKAGWYIDARSLYSVGESRKGLVFAVPDPPSLTPAEIALVTAFDEVGHKVSLAVGKDILYLGIRVYESLEARPRAS
jgi:hypothetical protein